jgi:hypothetical protein
VPAEPVARPERQLEVDLVALGERLQRGAPERLGHHVRRERAVVALRGGQADAVDRDRVAGSELGGQLRLDLEPASLQSADDPLPRDQPREHLTTP